MPTNEHGLTPKQEAFCQAYMVNGMNASAAARAAGYSAKTAHRMGQENMQKPAVDSRIMQLCSEHAKNTKITPEWIMQELADNVARAKADRQHGASSKALELLGKTHAMFTDKITLNTFEGLSDQELADVAAGKKKL